MQIKKVVLNNYRSHSHIEVAFSKGINLILGKNGRGKTSILEAIGLALFHMTDRTGKTKGKTFMKYGEKESSIFIEFLGNDGREYSIFHHYFLKKPKVSILKDMQTEEEYRDNIEEKLEELCGVKAEYRDIYENVIVAKQNDFINIFKETPENRARVFNKIFNTEIYNKLFIDLKGFVEQYLKEKEMLEVEENTLRLTLENKEERMEMLQQTEEKWKLYALKKEARLEEKQKIAKKIEQYEFIKREFETIKSKFSFQEQKIRQNKKELQERLVLAKKAKKARFLLEEHQESYQLYMELDKKIQEKKQEKNFLQKRREENQKLEEENRKLELLIKNNQTEEEVLQERMTEQQVLLLDLETRIEEDQKQQKELQTSLARLQSFWKEIEISLEKQKKWEQENFNLQQKQSLQEKNHKQKTEELLKLNIVEIQSFLQEIQEDKAEIQGKKERIAVYQQNIEDYQFAMHTLGQKICPFLKETCENMKGHEVDSYFQGEIQKTKKLMETLQHEIKALEEKLKKEFVYRKQEASYQLLQKEVQELEKDILQTEILWKEMLLEREREQYSFQTLLSQHNFASLEELQEKLRNLEDALLLLKIEEKEEEWKSLQKKQEILQERVEKLQKDRMSSLERQKQNILNIQEDLEEIWLEFLKEMESLETKMLSLQTSYRIYLENRKIADNLEEEKGKIRVLLLERDNLRISQREVNEKYRLLEKDLEQREQENWKDKLMEVERELLAVNETLGELGEKLKNDKQVLEKIVLQEEKIAGLSKKRNKIERKYKKAESLRKNIKEMGTQVSKNMLHYISEGASINFHKITGRSERIYWSNEEKDKYQVYLLGENRKIEYQLLSGGEQVSVAIAIRGTMAQYFSNSKFMILDEPTNNLDIEKRKLLAEYIGEILNHLEQSIIVTHDDSFREMAEKIIEL